jgi:hypothetical protein
MSPAVPVHYFISPEGSGGVKVIDSHFLFHDPKDTRPRWKVVEQVGITTNTITYWGETSYFGGEDLEYFAHRRTAAPSTPGEHQPSADGVPVGYRMRRDSAGEIQIYPFA